MPIIRQLQQRLEMHRLRCGNPQSGPMFASSNGQPLSLNNVLTRAIKPALPRCGVCKVAECDHKPKDGHDYQRDALLPEWHGWHAFRRGLGSNLYALGVPEVVIQNILRHANLSTTMTYYVKTTPEATQAAMGKLESAVPGRVN